MGEALYIEVQSRAALRAWLQANHAGHPSIWLVSYKKPSPFHIPYDAIVEEALCFGWIDSQSRGVDAERAALRLSPRNPKSGWSNSNKARIERLMAEGLMTEAGLRRVRLAQETGTWVALDGAHGLDMPADLTAALQKHAGAEAHFMAFPPGVRKAILEWITSAKRAETREKRVTETATLAARNERAHQWSKPGPEGRDKP